MYTAYPFSQPSPNQSDIFFQIQEIEQNSYTCGENYKTFLQEPESLWEYFGYFQQITRKSGICTGFWLKLNNVTRYKFLILWIFAN